MLLRIVLGWPGRPAAAYGRFLERVLDGTDVSRVRIETNDTRESPQTAPFTTRIAQANCHLPAAEKLLQSIGQEPTRVDRVLTLQQLRDGAEDEVRLHCCVIIGRRRLVTSTG
jgi:hypothetical protein